MSDKRLNFMKRQIWVLFLILLFSVAICSPFIRVFAKRSSGEPFTRFVRYEQTKTGMVAVFRVTNPSNSSFSYHAVGPTQPNYLYSLPSGGQWYRQPFPPREFKKGLGPLHLLPPHGSFEFTVPAPFPDTPWWHYPLPDAPAPPANAAFAVEVAFYPGSPSWVLRKFGLRESYFGDWMDRAGFFPIHVKVSEAAPNLQ